MKLNDFNKKVFIVAEVGNNHEGSFDLAQKMICEAAKSGADAVKFQTFIPELFISKSDPARLERLKGFQLSFKEFEKLSQVAESEGVIFFSTPLDLESAKFLNTIQPIFKIASSDNTFYPLLELVASFNKPVIVSTGLGDLSLIEKVRNFILDKNPRLKEEESLAFLHCVTSYPVPLEQVNLSALASLKEKFKNNIIGYSDHTLGINACIYAVAAGAKIIEKHFTLDKNYSDFRDHQLSADPSDLLQMVKLIRELEVMQGNGQKVIQQCEEALEPALRRSIAVSRDLEVGEVVSFRDLMWLRPGSDETPDKILSGNEAAVIGKIVKNRVGKGNFITISNVN